MIRRAAAAVFVLLIGTFAFADAIEEVRDAEIAFAKAFADRDAAKFFSFVSDDATFLSPHQTLSGKPEIVKRWGQFFNEKAAPFSWRPERVVVNAAGTTGLSTGPVFDKEGNQAGIYNSIWQRNERGEWKVLFDGPGAPSPVDEGTITTADGVKLHYRKTGHGQPTLVIPLDFLMWDVFSRLAERATVITYDPRSRGRSSRSETIGFESDIRDLEAVRRHFNIDRMTPIGYSYLGLVAAMYAREHPEHIDRLVQIAPAAMTPLERDFEPKLDQAAPAADVARRAEMLKAGEIDTRPREFCEADFKVFRYYLVGDPSHVDRVRSQCDLENEQPKLLWHFFKLLDASWKKSSISAKDLKPVSQPVLVIQGTKDRNTPYSGARNWTKSFPLGRLVTIEGAAHAALWEEQERVVGDIRTFVLGQWPADAEIVK
jgi:pimeloyl-ACP methyl ester carboxylesterase/ketosteroid isomerase-like protein